MGLFDRLFSNKQNNTIQPRIVKNEYCKCYDMVADYIVFDLETTGFDCSTCEIIEIGAIKFNNNVEVSRFRSLVKIRSKIPKEITDLTGITNNAVSSAPPIETVLENFKKFIGSYTLVAHNAPFDMKFLQTFFYNVVGCTLENRVIDTLPLSRKHLKQLENHKLSTIKQHFNMSVASHNALDDCDVTSALYKYCFDTFQNEKQKESLPDPECSEFDMTLFETTKQILLNHGIEFDGLNVSRGSVYTDICLHGFGVLRFKTGGKLCYWLIDENIKKFSAAYKTDLECKPGSKHEVDSTRLFIKSAGDLLNFQDYIITKFNSAKDSYESHEKWVRDGKPTSYGIHISVGFDENGEIQVNTTRMTK